MDIEKIKHYSLNTPATVYDEDAMTTLELAARTAGKVNDMIDVWLAFEKYINGEIDEIPDLVKEDVLKHINNGDFDKQISEYAGDLEGRLDNLFGSVTEGSTTLDAEVIDMRYGSDGVEYDNAGDAQRSQFGKTLFMRGLVDTVDKLPNVNAVNTAGVHILHFSEGATDIPQGLPITKWTGRIAALLTIQNAYTRQIFINDKYIYTRNCSNTANWSAWVCLNEITQNGGVNDSDYAHKLPDVNDAEIGFYSLHFADGSPIIPANLPWATWCGKVATLLTVQNEYRRQLLFSDGYIYTRYKGASTWSSWKNITGKETYVIDVNGSGDYTSILRALIAHPSNTRFIVKAGAYNVNTEYKNVYGADYFERYAGYQTANVHDRGLFLGDGVELIGEGLVKILFTSENNQSVKQYFSPLNTSQNNVIENIEVMIDDQSCRYLLHDDFADRAGVNVFRNMRFTGYSYLGTAIGGGFGKNNLYVVEGCVFNDIGETIAIAYHNNAENAENRLYIRGCYCEGSIAIKHYGVSVTKSKAVVGGCKFTKLNVTHGDKTKYPNENVTVYQFNNNADEMTENERIDALEERIAALENGGNDNGGGDNDEGIISTVSVTDGHTVYIPEGATKVTITGSGRGSLDGLTFVCLGDYDAVLSLDMLINGERSEDNINVTVNIPSDALTCAVTHFANYEGSSFNGGFEQTECNLTFKFM